MISLFFLQYLDAYVTDVTALRIESNVARTVKRESAKLRKTKSCVLPVGIER